MKYFPPEEEDYRLGVRMSVRMRIMLDLLKSHPLIAGDLDGEDSQGRSRIRLQSPKELVERAASIADLAVEAAEIRGWIKAVEHSGEELAIESARIARLKRQTEFRIEETTNN